MFLISSLDERYQVEHSGLGIRFKPTRGWLVGLFFLVMPGLLPSRRRARCMVPFASLSIQGRLTCLVRAEKRDPCGTLPLFPCGSYAIANGTSCRKVLFSLLAPRTLAWLPRLLNIATAVILYHPPAARSDAQSGTVLLTRA